MVQHLCFLFKLVSSFRKCPFGLETACFISILQCEIGAAKIPVQNILQNLVKSSTKLVMLRFGFIDFDSIFRSTIRSRFDSVSIFFTICTPLLTQLDSCVAAWEWQCCGAGHPRCPLSDVRTSPTLVNRPTCLRAYNTRGCR